VSHGSPWAVGRRDKRRLSCNDMQRGSCVSKTRPRVTEAPARRVGRRCYHDMQTVRQALQHQATVHCCADNRSQAWHYSVAPCSWPLMGLVGRDYNPTGWGYARLRPDRTELRWRPLTTCQDRWGGARHVPSAPSLPCTGIQCPSFCIGVRPP
jgi:hypothetical protein